MTKDNIIYFPANKNHKPRDSYKEPTDMDIAADVLESAIFELIDLGYDPHNDPQMARDLGLILNMLYAMITRDIRDHFLHMVMDELSEELDNLKADLNNDDN